MPNNIVNNYASTIITIFQDVIRNYERNIEIIKQAEDELNDLYHECELSNPKDMYKGYLVYKEIREVRIRRRTAKEENELLKDMYDYFMGQSGQAFKGKIQSIQGNSARIRTTQEQRTYQPRQRNDLTINNLHSTANKPFEEMLSEFNRNKAYMKNGKMRR
jgi:hypothetical protein